MSDIIGQAVRIRSIHYQSVADHFTKWHLYLILVSVIISKHRIIPIFRRSITGKLCHRKIRKHFSAKTPPAKFLSFTIWSYVNVHAGVLVCILYKTLFHAHEHFKQSYGAGQYLICKHFVMHHASDGACDSCLKLLGAFSIWNY